MNENVPAAPSAQKDPKRLEEIPPLGPNRAPQRGGSSCGQPGGAENGVGPTERLALMLILRHVPTLSPVRQEDNDHFHPLLSAATLGV